MHARVFVKRDRIRIEKRKNKGPHTGSETPLIVPNACAPAKNRIDASAARLSKRENLNYIKDACARAVAVGRQSCKGLPRVDEPK